MKVNTAEVGERKLVMSRECFSFSRCFLLVRITGTGT